MTTLTLTNVSQDLASLEFAGRLVYIERCVGGRLRVYTLAGGMRSVGMVGTPIQAVRLAVKEFEDLSMTITIPERITTIPERITPDLVRRATEALVAHGCTIQRHKTGSAGLGHDPASEPAYTVRRGRQIVASGITARELVELAARAAGEANGD